jgi:hypothetical protein
VEPILPDEGDELERVLTRREARDLVSSWAVDWCPPALAAQAAVYLFDDEDWRRPRRSPRYGELSALRPLVSDGWLLGSSLPLKLHNARVAMDLVREMGAERGALRTRPGDIVTLQWMYSNLQRLGRVLGIAPRAGALVSTAHRSGNSPGLVVQPLPIQDSIEKLVEVLGRTAMGSCEVRDGVDFIRLNRLLVDSDVCLTVTSVFATTENLRIPPHPWSSIPS